mgnify:FL=1|tara:strand:+ start:364 stop:570 length:207 start_codon:yes stop_codon:yes gene_type:complete
MNREATIHGKIATLSKLDKEYVLRGSSGSTINLPHFFFEHLEWKINQDIDVSIIQDEDDDCAILIEKR